MAQVEQSVGLEKTPANPAPAASDLSQQVFSNPQEFLKTLKADFKQLSFGQPDITLAELQEYAEHGHDPRGKAAAGLAAQHFGELSNFYRQDYITGQRPSDKITTRDIDFAIDMDRGETLGHALYNAAADLSMVATSGVTGLINLTIGASELNTGIGLVGGEATALETCGLLGLGVVALGVGGYFGYEAFHERSRLSQLAKKDHAMFQDWLQPPLQNKGISTTLSVQKESNS